MKKNLLSGEFHELPDDVAAALLPDQQIIEIWNSLTPIQRNEWICWVITVKKSATRQAHIARMTDELKEGKKTPCCWPGCPHRRPSAGKWFREVNG